MSREFCQFKLVGCPPNWSNLRLHWAVLARNKDQWKSLAAFQARSAMHRRGWPAATEDDPQRLVTIVRYAVQLMDDDGAVASLKPCVDGMKGSLIWDDRRRYMKLQVKQEKIEHRTDQRLEFTVERPVVA